MARQLRDRAKIQKPKRLIDEVEDAPRKKRGKHGPTQVAAAPQSTVESPEPTSPHLEESSTVSSSHGVQVEQMAPKPPASDTKPPDSPTSDSSLSDPSSSEQTSSGAVSATPAGPWHKLPAELRLEIYKACGFPHRLREIPGSEGPFDEQPAYYRYHVGHVFGEVSRSIRNEVRHEERELDLKGLGTDIVINSINTMYQVELLIKLILHAIAGEERCIEAEEEVESTTWWDLAIRKPIIEHLDRSGPRYTWTTLYEDRGMIPVHEYIVISDDERTTLGEWLQLQLAIERKRKPGAQPITYRILYNQVNNRYGRTFDRWDDDAWTDVGSWLEDWCDLDTAGKIRITTVLGPEVSDTEMARFKSELARCCWVHEGFRLPAKTGFDQTRPEEDPLL